MTTLSIKKSDFKVFGLWLLAAIAGRMLFQGLQGIIGEPLQSAVATGALFAILSGLTRAIAQAGALYKQIEDVKQWALLTLTGVALNGILIVFAQDWIIEGARLLNPEQVWGFYAFFAIVQALQGAIIGFFQWLVFRLEVERAGWWIFFVALGNAIGVLTLIGVNQYISSVSVDFAQFLSVVVNALITGSGLVWLLRNPRLWDEEDDDEMLEEVDPTEEE